MYQRAPPPPPFPPPLQVPGASQLPEPGRREIVLNCALNSKAFLIDTDKVRGEWGRSTAAQDSTWLLYCLQCWLCARGRWHMEDPALPPARLLPPGHG